MRWLASLSSRFAARAVQAFSASISLVPNFMAQVAWQFASTYPELARKAYGSNAVVYACVRLLAQSIPEPPLVASTEGADGELTPLSPDHPLAVLLKRPNELMTEYEFWELVEIHVSLSGGSWWWKQRDNAGRVVNLWPLRPDRIVPAYQPDLNAPEGQRLLYGWAYTPPGGGTPIVIPRAHVLAFGNPDPAGESGGVVETLGPVQVLANEIAADNEATSFVGSLLANYAQPSMLIKTKMPIRDIEIARRLKAQFMTELGGAHRGEPALLDADTEIEKLSFDLKQLEFPDLRALAESRISAAFGVPAILVGLKVGLDKSTYSNFESAREFFTETTLSAKWRRYSDQMTNDLAPEYGPGIVCRFDTTKVKALAGQRMRHAEPVRDAFDRGAVTLAQYVEAIGQTLPDGVDGDVYYVPSSVTVVKASDLGKEPPKPEIVTLPPPPQNALPAPEEDDTTDAEDDMETPPLPSKAVRSLADDVERRADDARNRRTDAALPSILAALADQRELAVSVWNETAKAWPAADQLLPDDDAALNAAARNLWSLTLGDAVADADKALGGIGLSFSLENEWVQDELAAVATRVRGMNDTARAVLRDIIGRAASEGLSVPQVADLIRSCWAFGEARAETIARTETAVAYSSGSLRSYAESGLVDEVEVLDGDYDAECQAINGQRKPLDWANANLIQHPRCRRAFAPIVRE